jgi:hypothetical protein
VAGEMSLGSLSQTVFATAYDVSLEIFRRESYLEPEKKLMLAVLEDAIACIQSYVFARDRKKKVLFQEAEHWVQDTNGDGPFSFANVCETLGFAPDYLRQGLSQWKTARLKSGARGNANIYHYQLTPRNGKRKSGIAVTGGDRHRVRRLPPALLALTATSGSKRPRTR